MPYDPQRSRPRPPVPDEEPAPVDALLDAPVPDPDLVDASLVDLGLADPGVVDAPAAEAPAGVEPVRSLRAVPDPVPDLADGPEAAPTAGFAADGGPGEASTPGAGRGRPPKAVLVVFALAVVAAGVTWIRRRRRGRGRR
jgi:hypothetical protein